jgi:hypothetical protein
VGKRILAVNPGAFPRLPGDIAGFAFPENRFQSLWPVGAAEAGGQTDAIPETADAQLVQVQPRKHERGLDGRIQGDDRYSVRHSGHAEVKPVSQDQVHCVDLFDEILEVFVIESVPLPAIRTGDMLVEPDDIETPAS